MRDVLPWASPCGHVDQGFVGLVGTGPAAGVTELLHGRPQ